MPGLDLQVYAGSSWPEQGPQWSLNAYFSIFVTSDLSP